MKTDLFTELKEVIKPVTSQMLIENMRWVLSFEGPDMEVIKELAEQYATLKEKEGKNVN